MRNAVMGWLNHNKTVQSHVKATPQQQQHKAQDMAASVAACATVTHIKDNDIRQITMEKAIDLTFWW